MSTKNLYELHGYANRRDYLECLAADNDYPLDVVLALANLLGPGEDFDGLVSHLEDEFA